MEFIQIKENLEKRGFQVVCFETAQEAAAYLDSSIDGTTVGFGGSMTLKELGLYDLLAAHNQVFWHWRMQEEQSREEMHRSENAAAVYLASVNGLAETGEIINIDGRGNRVASACYGHERVYFVAGRNKIEKDFAAALYRARNVAGPQNAKRLGMNTPCAAEGNRCYDCNSPERICNELLVFWHRPVNQTVYEVVLINEDLGL